MSSIPLDSLFWVVAITSLVLSALLWVSSHGHARRRIVSICWLGTTLICSATYRIGATGPLAIVLIPIFGAAELTIGFLVVALVQSKVRWACLGFTLLLPIATWLSFELGSEVSPHRQRMRGAQTIVRSINQYHAATAQYPERLTDLTPDFLAAIPDAHSSNGWLYTTENSVFVLGYIDGVDKMGYFVCYYMPASPEEKCDWEAQRKWFTLSSTPTPE
jgi:hypothetical protein